jgi:hypothetical protein
LFVFAKVVEVLPDLQEHVGDPANEGRVVIDVVLRLVEVVSDWLERSAGGASDQRELRRRVG